MSGGTMDVSWRLESRIGARRGLRACNRHFLASQLVGLESLILSWVG